MVFLMPNNQGSFLGTALRELAATHIHSLPDAQRREAIHAAISLIPIPKYAAPTETWLRELAHSQATDPR